MHNGAYPYAIKNQREAIKITPNGGILRSEALNKGLWMRGAGSLWYTYVRNKIAGVSNTLKLSTRAEPRWSPTNESGED